MTTNFEKIKAMDIEEMAQYFCHWFFHFTGGCEACPYYEIKHCGVENPFKQWLQQEDKG